MIPRIKLLGSTAIIMLSIASVGHAATLTASQTDWAKKVSGSVYHTTSLGSDFDALSTVNLVGGGSVGLTDTYSGTPLGGVETVGSTWGAWSGGYTGQVILTDDADGDQFNNVTLKLSGLSAFGFEVLPSASERDVVFTVSLSSGTPLKTLVNTKSGAQFFGVYGGDLQSLTISTADNDFALGNFVSSPIVSTVPLPASAPLFGLGLMALAGFGLTTRRRADAK